MRKDGRMTTWRQCETCEFHGPELPTMIADLREFHRAIHHLGRTLVEEFDRGMRWLATTRRTP